MQRVGGIPSPTWVRLSTYTTAFDLYNRCLWSIQLVPWQRLVAAHAFHHSTCSIMQQNHGSTQVSGKSPGIVLFTRFSQFAGSQLVIGDGALGRLRSG